MVLATYSMEVSTFSLNMDRKLLSKMAAKIGSLKCIQSTMQWYLLS